MATLAQLQAEPWYGREIVTDELDWLGDELCRRTGRPRYAFGTKGDVLHLNGAHRSQEWIINSRYCTDRWYTRQPNLTADQQRHVAGADFTPGSVEEMIAQSRRLMAEMKAGRLEEVLEIYCNVDGDRVVDGWDNVRNRAVTSDSSHLWHWHLTIDRRHLRNRALMERILAIALGEDDDMDSVDRAQLTNAHWYAYTTAMMLPKIQVIPGNDPNAKPIQVDNEIVKAVRGMQADLDELAARPPVQSAPVDPAVVQAAVTAALSNPDALAAIAKAVADENARRQQA